MLLGNKVAVVYGAGGPIGSAVSRAFAREGARVFLAGRTLATLETVAAGIRDAGGAAEVGEVDALDEEAVGHHADAIAEKAGRIDVSFNSISHGDVHGLSLMDMPFDDFFRPISTALRAQFLTTRAAARHMVDQGSGVIMAITATTSRMKIPHVGGTGVTFDAIESLSRQWAVELGPRGVRVVWLRTTGIPEAFADPGGPVPDYGVPGGMTTQQHIAWMESKTMLNRLTTLADVGDAAAFAASDRAGAMTGAGMNLTSGSVPDY